MIQCKPSPSMQLNAILHYKNIKQAALYKMQGLPGHVNFYRIGTGQLRLPAILFRFMPCNPVEIGRTGPVHFLDIRSTLVKQARGGQYQLVLSTGLNIYTTIFGRKDKSSKSILFNNQVYCSYFFCKMYILYMYTMFFCDFLDGVRYGWDNFLRYQPVCIKFVKGKKAIVVCLQYTK